MLEVGKAGSAGTGKGVLPVLRDGAVVATLRASGWKEAATAQVGDREWVFAKSKRELTGRWAVDPDDAVRLAARQVSFWRGTWAIDLDGTSVDVQNVSRWKNTHRFLVDGRQMAESGSTGGWYPRLTLTADPALPLEHQIFLLWFELVLARRNDAAVGAAVGAAVIGGSS